MKLKTLLLLLSSLSVTFTGFSANATSVNAAINNPSRPTQDVKRDVNRKPYEVLTFFGVKPGMTVLDVYATSGYYTELLSHIVSPTGKVISHNSHGYRKFVGQSINDRFLKGRLANVEKYYNHPKDVKLKKDTLYMTLVALIYHDLYVTTATNLITASDRKNLIGQLFKAIKPGGILGIVDHAAPRGSGKEAADKWHRLSATIVTSELTELGFELVDESKALRNRTDPRDISIFDNKVRRKTDRYILKFRKPKP
ncbi:MAG: putative methyltransferase [Phenylobacterium sp.]|jgi:predicted methyltransferase